jgi:histone deacetylase 1/2/histone deacetylase 8
LPSPNTPHPFTLSIPLAAYASPKTYKAIFPSVESVREAFQPDYVVLQLGADGLPRDPVGLYGRWGVEGDGGMLWCVEQVRRWGIPIVVLGGGGYDHPNTARAWARVTALVVSGSIAGRPTLTVQLSQELSGDTEVPHHEHFPEYAPSFTLEVSESESSGIFSLSQFVADTWIGNIKDENYSESIAQINETFQNISERIKEITAAHI